MSVLFCRRARLSIAAALCVASSQAWATIAPGDASSSLTYNTPYTGNGELFFLVFDSTAKISYALDLGETLNDFFIYGQQDGGNQRFWRVDDAQWSSFLSQVNAANLRWSVLGRDTTGGTVAGGQRLFTTAQQGDEAKISTFTNQLFQNGLGATQAGTFFNAVNTTGTHGAPGVPPDYRVNGSSVNADTDPGNGYFGDNSVGLSTTLNGNAPFGNSNEVGKSSWFYYLTRSGPDQLGTVLVDEFDNLIPGTSGDGYWGFINVDPALYPTSPYAGSYLLSYTIAPYTMQAQISTAAGRARAAMTEYRSGDVSQLVFAPASEYLDYVATPLAPAPEPASVLMLFAGLLALAAKPRDRRGRGVR